MLAKRIIPCLDVKDGRVVKGVNFVDLRDAGDPVELASRYDHEGADELIFLDITASHERREIIVDVARATRRAGVHAAHGRRRPRGLDDIRMILLAGADKVSINTAAVEDPEFVRAAAPSVSAPSASSWRSTPSACRAAGTTGRRVGRSTSTAAARRPASTPSSGRGGWTALGAGEILLTSMDRDGTRDGYDIALTRAIADAVRRAGDRLGRRRHARAPLRRAHRGRGRRGAGGLDLPLRHLHDR